MVSAAKNQTGIHAGCIIVEMMFFIVNVAGGLFFQHLGIAAALVHMLPGFAVQRCRYLIIFT